MEEEFSYDALFRKALDVALERSCYGACKMIVEAEVGQWKAQTAEYLAKGELPYEIAQAHDNWPIITGYVYQEGDVAIELPTVSLLDVCRAYVSEGATDAADDDENYDRAGLVAWMLRRVADELEKPA